MENPWVVVTATVAIIALSAFFVAVEFALIAARRHRIEESATTSRSARAALRSSSELTLLLAGSQLGITVCALALGAITKPAVHHWLTPLFEDWGLALWLADVAGFVLALVIVTFLHLVVGEMAPKSWAIAHPERSAIMLALPMRAFMWLTRPLLHALNESANWCLRRVGVDATDSVSSGQDPAALRELVEHSANVGALDASYTAQLFGALELETMTLADIVRRARVVSVPRSGTAADVVAASRASGHLRILVADADGRVTGAVHVRDTLALEADTSVEALVHPVARLAGTTTVYDALARMRRDSSHLVLVEEEGHVVGVVTITDLLRQLFPYVAAA
ncbi:hemolysin family protein [Nocardioides sp. zg-DK7169]|uniref:hemolysin family protein n=1 Tax=Nocardioides sp. zg-DK7169 TaxID=2736600 RepID=UPI0015579C5C|nr:hemolysin family protein [Nocardioides sp. zg-DK7169]NPC96219.1 HlyC/CorC family transporter [Nocardioides sp. zg-DK7169]